MRILIFLILMIGTAVADQVTEWRSNSGSQVKMLGTQNMQFQIQIITPQGDSFVYPARWLEVHNSFSYTAQGSDYYCSYCNGGWSITVNAPNSRYQWDFVRWISK